MLIDEIVFWYLSTCLFSLLAFENYLKTLSVVLLCKILVRTADNNMSAVWVHLVFSKSFCIYLQSTVQLIVLIFRRPAVPPAERLSNTALLSRNKQRLISLNSCGDGLCSLRGRNWNYVSDLDGCRSSRGMFYCIAAGYSV